MCVRSLRLPSLLLCLTLGLPVQATEAPSAIEAQSRALQRASDAVVGLRALAVDDARSAATLGRARRVPGWSSATATWC